MKRFTDTNKWDDPWFWRLSVQAKLLFLYLCDHCDNSGVVDIDLPLFSTRIGETIQDQHLAEIGDRLKRLETGKWCLVKFVRFQFGELKPTNLLHRSVIKLIASNQITGIGRHQSEGHGLSHSNGISHKEKEQEKEKDSEGGSGGYRPAWADCQKWLAAVQNDESDYTKAECRSAFLALDAGGWMWGKNRVADWRSALERQIQSDRQRNGSGGGRQKTPLDLKTIIGAKQSKVDALRNQYAHETATGVQWSNPDKRKEYSALKKEIGELNNQLSNMA